MLASITAKVWSAVKGSRAAVSTPTGASVVKDPSATATHTDAPVGVDTAAREPLTADHTFAVIDASTGNLLISGVYRRG